MWKTTAKTKCEICPTEMIYFKYSKIKPRICIECYRTLIEAKQQSKSCKLIDGKLVILNED